MNTEQFDLIDSICESYEDLLSVNEALAHFDIKEQELICMESAISGDMGHFNRTEKDLKQITAEAIKVSNNAFKLCTWRYIQFTKMVNAFLSMSRRYFMTCLLSASSIVNAYENAQK